MELSLHSGIIIQYEFVWKLQLSKNPALHDTTRLLEQLNQKKFKKLFHHKETGKKP
jgi:hypothetical protein